MAPTVKTPVGNAPVVPIVMLMIGGYVMWFGVHFFKGDQKWPTDPVKSVLSGGAVTTATYTQEGARQANLAAYMSSVGAGGDTAVAAGAAAAGGGLSGGLGGIAGDAQKYVGAGYVYGGTADRVGNWDCSSFVSYVLGHDMGLPLPGGHWNDPGFPPHAHGPTAGSYALYGTAINRDQVAAGDLVVWSTHVGIATDNNNIVSARDEAEGTGMSTIDGTTKSLGESVRYRRVTQGTGTGGGLGSGGPTGSIVV